MSYATDSDVYKFPEDSLESVCRYVDNPEPVLLVLQGSRFLYIFRTVLCFRFCLVSIDIKLKFSNS